MADATAVFKGISKQPGVSYSVLVPNERALNTCLPLLPGEVAVFVSATESFSLKNINCSINTSLERSHALVKTALSNGIRVRGMHPMKQVMKDMCLAV